MCLFPKILTHMRNCHPSDHIISLSYLSIVVYICQLCLIWQYGFDSYTFTL
jgi:hypothetical protein